MFAAQGISFNRFTVLTGSHGAGKSYLMRALRRVTILSSSVETQGPPYLDAYHRRTLAEPPSGKFEVEYGNDSRVVRWPVDLAASEGRFVGFPEFEPGDEPWTTYVDPSSALFGQHYFDGEPIYRTRLSAAEAYKKDESVRLRGILGKTYERLAWQQCDANGLDIPYFSVRSNGRDYGSDAMSTGEVWVHHVLWILRTASPSNIVLIDEPESFLSPAGHAAFLNEIARKSLASNAQVIVSTHSAAMIAATPTEFIRVITSGTSGAAVIQPSTTAGVLRVLGQEPGIRAVVVVEDEFAARVVKRVLSVLAPDIVGSVEVVKAEGADSAISIGCALGSASRLRSCVVLDGDQRGRMLRGPEAVSVAYLPGDIPEVAVSASSRSNPAALARMLGRAPDAIDFALEINRFDDHHDWFAATAMSLDVSIDVLIDSIILVWLTDEATSGEVTELVEQVRTSLQL
ncbi:AAA family ATPase [Kribbella solani]|nr:AAA family ATPase [Kribbella solani]